MTAVLRTTDARVLRLDAAVLRGRLDERAIAFARAAARRPVLLLALILGGLGFAIHILWWIALVVLVIWLIGFVVRVGEGGSRGRWYRW